VGLAALLLVGAPAGATPVAFDFTLTETSPGSAQYVGSFFIDSAVLESGKAINVAPIGIALALAGFDFTTPSSGSNSVVFLGEAGLVGISAVFPADQPDVALFVSETLEWSLVENSKDITRTGTYAFALAPEPAGALLLASALVLLALRRRCTPP
jgi:hypothetical protein